LRVIGVDVVDTQLEEATAQGAEHVFNSKTDKDYLEKIRRVTGGGVDAAVNFTAAKRAYDDMPGMVKSVHLPTYLSRCTKIKATNTFARAGEGLIMVVGIPQQPLQFNALDIAMGRFRVKGSNNGTNYNMRPAIEFSVKHGIRPHVTHFPLEEVGKMIDLMHDGKARGRLAVRFGTS
jgi:alcohol dehydrogenase, propanol-preferring